LDNVHIDKYSVLKIKADNDKDLEIIRSQIVERGFLVSSLSDTIEQANKIFKIIQIFLFFFGFIALVVSAIGMFNTMTITLLERTNEIGIMRSIGISGRDIRKIFLMEASLMGLFGGIGGVAVGYVAGQAVNFLINILAKNFGGTSISLFYSPWQFILIVVGFSIVVGFLTGIYPSIRASRLNPLDALRYK
jgi:ABC-type antimicrobial peptide transport system permease subunit